MFRMARQTGLLLSNHLLMVGRDGRHRAFRKACFRVTSNAFRTQRSTKSLMTARAMSDIRMITAQIAWSPVRFRVSHRAPPQPDDNYNRRNRDSRNHPAGEREIMHRSKPAEIHRSYHVQRGEDQKHQRHRRMNRLPDAKRFFL